MQEVVGAGHGVLEVVHKYPAKGFPVQNPSQCSHRSFSPLFIIYILQAFWTVIYDQHFYLSTHVRHVAQVTQKHSGSLFLYSGDNGGAFAKNSYGNL
jgi:hypothetical protein